MSDLIHDILLWFGRTPKQPSLLSLQINWTNEASWMDRLVAYRQLDIWLSNKHNNHENQNRKV
jgi:hypothetical protein